MYVRKTRGEYSYHAAICESELKQTLGAIVGGKTMLNLGRQVALATRVCSE